MAATSGSDDHDSPWKEVLEAYFEAFMDFFFPDAHRLGREPVVGNLAAHQSGC
jgi:hypothetical protein